MIAEDFPAVKSLSPENQLELAAELIELATDRSVNQPDPEIVEALNQRLAEYRKNPDQVSTFKEIRERILKQAS
ncbi:MAG: addiction module protein [Verrucomicrobiales bacterium]